MERRNFLKGLLTATVGAAVLPKLSLPTAAPIAPVKSVAYIQMSKELFDDVPEVTVALLRGEVKRLAAEDVRVALIATPPELRQPDDWDGADE